MKKSFLGVVLVLVLAMASSCSNRLVDFTVISTKNAEIGVDRSKGKPTEGKKFYFLTMWNLKDAIDIALENAGPEYDLLIDGVVTYKSFFGISIKVKGLAVSSKQLRSELGEEGYQEWLKQNNLTDPAAVE